MVRKDIKTKIYCCDFGKEQHSLPVEEADATYRIPFGDDAYIVYCINHYEYVEELIVNGFFYGHMALTPEDMKKFLRNLQELMGTIQFGINHGDTLFRRSE